MTEAEWLACSDPEPMLAFLEGQASDRKLRLFAAACSRRIWHWLDEPGRAAVETAERFADGRADADELRSARLACRLAGGQAAWYAAASNPARAAGNAARSARSATPAAFLPEGAAQAGLLRDIFGNPFHPVAVEPSWLAWKGGAVVRLAEAIYEDRRFSDLRLLAATLEDAGCTAGDLLTHCRTPGEHVRGCWAIDLLVRGVVL
jgi:hypothetical protein